MLYASGVDSILNNRQSIDKASNNIINGQTTNDEETDMLDRSDPKNFGEVAHGYKKDLAEILPFTGSNRTHELINFAHGFTEDGR